MRGRDLFNMSYPVMRALSFILFLFPRGVLKHAWSMLDIFPGFLGLGLRYVFALRLCKSIGRNVFWGRCVEIVSWDSLELGNNVSIHKDCYIDATGGVSIGSDVSIAHSSSILSFEHTWSLIDVPIRSNPCSYSPVVICEDVWVGCGCRILAGVTINSRSVIAAGAVVTKDVESNTIVGGTPARLIKRI
ncbi:acyltransferase [Pseudomonas daroniae]|uniref:acyltransferase n=1 Tax=Phytopseudomonas daroniae TaxID=2487519 RepID=UPI0010383FE6|nr:acyltransferase [Pseudomonas daroniae]